MIEDFDVLGIAGNGAARRVLTEANVSQADILIAVTDADEVNMVACMAGKRAGVPLTIARVRDPDYLESDHTVQRLQWQRPSHSTRARRGGRGGKAAEYPGALEVESFALYVLLFALGSLLVATTGLP